MESEFEQEEERTPESLVRRRWAEAVARGQTQQHEEQERQRAEAAARLARVRLQVARNLEKSGKIYNALKFLRQDRSRVPRHGRGSGGHRANRCNPSGT